MLQLSSRLTGGRPPTNPFAALGGGFDGFGGSLNPPTAPNLSTNPVNPTQTHNPTDPTNTQGTTDFLPQNPGLDLAMMQRLMNMRGGVGSGGGLFGIPATSTPTDTRPPEERFQDQLRVSIPPRLYHELVNDVPNHF